MINIKRLDLSPASYGFRSITALMLAIMILSTVGCATNNAKYNEAMIESMMDHNDVIVATGYGVISIQDGDSPAHKRLLSIRASKLDAYRVLLEQVYGQYLDTTTTVAEMVVKSDSFRSRVQGLVYGARLVSITTVGEDTYETTLSLDNTIVSDLRTLYLAATSRPQLAGS
jgi:outer membrane protein FlgP